MGITRTLPGIPRVGSFDGMRSLRRRLTSVPRWAAAVLGVAVVVLVTLTALGARGLPGFETRPPPFLINIDLTLILRVVLGTLAGLGFLLFILLLLPGGPPVELPERQKVSPLKLLAGIVLFIAIVMLLQPSVGPTGQEPESFETGDITAELEPSRSPQAGSRWGLIILGGAVLLLVVGVGAVARPASQEPETAQPDPPELVTGIIDTVLAELEESTDPRRVVIGAYARMERTLTAAGLPRRDSEAPLEYLARSLRRLHVSRPAVSRLTQLFEIARFSRHEILPDMGLEAVAALTDIRNELSGVAS